MDDDKNGIKKWVWDGMRDSLKRNRQRATTASSSSSYGKEWM